MTEKQQRLIHYSDMKNIIDTAVEEAVVDTSIEIAENLIKLGLSDKDTANATSLTVKEVEKIHQKITKK